MCTCIVHLGPCTVAVCISSLTMEHRNVSIQFSANTKVTLTVSSKPKDQKKVTHGWYSTILDYVNKKKNKDLFIVDYNYNT